MAFSAVNLSANIVIKKTPEPMLASTSIVVKSIRITEALLMPYFSGY